MRDFLSRLGDGFGVIGDGVLSFVPIVAVILILIIVNRLLSRQAQRATGLRFRNQLIITGITFVGILVIVIVLPVEAGVRGQLLTLIGIIISVTISLSSSTFLGNAMAGIMLKTVRNFRSGDFVEVGEHFGRVTERGLFHTEIQTPNRDLTTLPNLYLATSAVTVTRASGTIVDATVSLGYDTPHGVIEALLLEAAERAELQDSFVQVLELGDFSVTYRVAGLLEETRMLLTYRSRLKVAMLDCLHGNGVEIVSPNFMNVRDFERGHQFRPADVATSTPPPNDAPVAVVFDKADQAESLLALQNEHAALAARGIELQQEIKAAPDDATRARLQAEWDRGDARQQGLAAEIAAAEEQEKNQED